MENTSEQAQVELILTNESNTTNSAQVIRKPTAAIQTGNPLGVLENRLFNALIFHAQKNNSDGAANEILYSREQELPIKTVLPQVGLANSHNYDLLKNPLKNLVTTAICWNSLGIDKSQEWGVCTFLSSAKIRKGVLIYRINQEIIHQFLNPRLYGRIKLLMGSTLKKKASIVLYEAFIDYQSRYSKYSFHLKYSVSELIILFNLKKKKTYNQDAGFGYLNRDLIGPAVKEINKETDLSVEITTIKDGKTVTDVKFKVSQSEQSLINAAINGLLGEGVKRSVAYDLLTKYSIEKIEEKLNLLHAIKLRKKIPNPAGWVIRAIVDDYCALSDITEITKDSKNDRVENDLNAVTISMYERYENDRKASIEALIENKGKEWHDEKYKEFLGLVENSPGISFKVARQRLSTLSETLIEKETYQLFLSWLANNALEEYLIDFNTYTRKVSEKGSQVGVT